MTSTRPEDAGPHDVSGRHWPLLGTVVDVRASASTHRNAARAERIVCAEIARLEQIFSVFDEASTLRRWIADETTHTPTEFDELMAVAMRWQRCSRGAFNVSTRRLGDLWARAGADGCRPSQGELTALAKEIVDPPYRFEGSELRQIGDCASLDLNAIAKGFIVDLAVGAAWQVCSLDSLMVSAGGDIVHRGQHPVQIGIDDPSNRLDGAPPLVTVGLCDAAIATSGSARRGVAIGAEWESHVIDPRSGEPARGSLSATVIAPTAATADVVATIVNVMDPADGLEFVDTLNSTPVGGHPAESFADVAAGPITCWIVDRSGDIHQSDR